MLLADLPIKYQMDIKAVGSVITFSWHTHTKQSNTDTLGWLNMFNSKSPLVQKSLQNWNSKTTVTKLEEITAEEKKKQCHIEGHLSVFVDGDVSENCAQVVSSSFYQVLKRHPKRAKVLSGDTSCSLVFGYHKSPRTHQVTDNRVSKGGRLLDICDSLAMGYQKDGVCNILAG